jgi:transposase
VARKGQKFKKYTMEERMKAIHDNVDLGISAQIIANEIGTTKSTVDMWIYRSRHINTFGNKRGRPKDNDKIDYKERYEILKKYQAFLKKQQEKR